MKTFNECFELNNGVKIPCIGFGTYKSTDGCETENIKTALELGYRYFDTASFYKNEEMIAKAIEEMKIPREELFLVSKVWKTEMGYENTKKAFQDSLDRLQTDYLDMYLIHWPIPEPGFKDWEQLIADTWKAMEELYKEGKIRAIGLSNFLPHHIESLLKTATVMPAANQLEFHPGHTQELAVAYCQERNILVQAWSPLGRARMLGHSLLAELAEKYSVTPAQICIRYVLQRQIIPLPKASSAERMKQNQEVFSFEISQDDMYRIGTMQPAGWSGEHPDFERIIL